MPDWTSILYKIAPGAHASVVNAITPHMGLIDDHGVTSLLRKAHFLAQMAHESAGFATLEEYGGPRYFRRYDGRKDLGNVMAGDGAKFHGRGLIQITGRSNYSAYGKKIGVDIIKDPGKAAEGRNAVLIACLFWADHGLNELADKDDLQGITKRINGGLNGFADRKACLVRAKAVLKV